MEFEVVQTGRRVPRWRLRDSKTGAIVPLSPGKVHLPPTVEENRRVREAVDTVLTHIARKQQDAANGS